MNNQPLVSVIIPSTPDRVGFNKAILKQHHAQIYPNKELIFDTGSGLIGVKRNQLCEKSAGKIIAHMDSDDLYAPDWISQSVAALLFSKADIVGLSTLNFYDQDNDLTWEYNYHAALGYGSGLPWVAGATMCYWKSFWEKSKFQEINIGEDNQWVWGTNGITPVVYNHGHTDLFMASIHSSNTSKRETNNARWRELVGKEKKLIKQMWNL